MEAIVHLIKKERSDERWMLWWKASRLFAQHKHSLVLEMVQLSQVHVRSVVLWERARLRVYDLRAARTGIPSLRKMLVIKSFRDVWNLESFWWLCRCFVWSILFSGYPFRRRMSWNMIWHHVTCGCRLCWASVPRDLSSIRFSSLRMKLILDFLGITDWWCTNSGFLGGFF